MPAPTLYQTPSLTTFIKSLKTHDIETSIELLISLLKRRQIKHSRPCALATAELLLRVVSAERIRDASKLLERIRHVGRRLIAAQPREMAVGNIVRRVLGVVREVVESDQGAEGSESSSTPSRGTKSTLTTNLSGLSLSSDSSSDAARRPTPQSSTSYAGQGPQVSSLLSFLETPLGRSPAVTPPTGSSPNIKSANKGTNTISTEKIDIKAEIIDGIKELLDELQIVDAQIAESALDHIHSYETILTHGSSQTVQKFLTTAAKKRKFTVVHAESYPNDHQATHATILTGGKADGIGDGDERWKPLTSMGITVILIPDTAVFALMPRINKVLLSPHAVLANGSLVAAAGTSTIALAAHTHHVPVVVLAGVYKLSPLYPFDTDELVECGDPGKVVGYHEGEFMDKVDVVNPVQEVVESGLVDLFVTNLGGVAGSFLYRVVGDHYEGADVVL